MMTHLAFVVELLVASDWKEKPNSGEIEQLKDVKVHRTTPNLLIRLYAENKTLTIVWIVTNKRENELLLLLHSMQQLA